MPFLGWYENLCRSWWGVCDINLVLMTHIGLVAMVLLPPAMMEDQKLMAKVFSATCQLLVLSPHRRSPTVVLSQPYLALVVDREPHRPGRQVSHYDRAQPPIHAAYPLLCPYHPCCADQALVHPCMATLVRSCQPALRLELCLDDVQRTGDDARGKATDGPGQGIKLRVRGVGSPSIHQCMPPRGLHRLNHRCRRRDNMRGVRRVVPV